MVRLSFYLLSTLSILTSVYAQPTLTFDDVTRAVGIVQERNRTKWGGPSVADLDGDGIYDLLLSFHASAPVQIYWGLPNGTFQKDDFFDDGDVHGITVAHRTTTSSTRLLSINKGGGRGNRPSAPSIFTVRSNRNIVNVTDAFGIGEARNRGRLTMFMDLSRANVRTRRRRTRSVLRRTSGPDALIVGFVGGKDTFPQHAYENINGTLFLRDPLGFEDETEGRAALADVDGDGLVEVISFPRIQVYQLVEPFVFQDITDSTFPSVSELVRLRTVTAIAELDFNNDGSFDIYIARALSSDATAFSRPGAPISDMLFKQTPSGLVEVSSTAGIPADVRSSGLTTGDFDNNGFIDVFVATFEGPDFFLMNNGNETFTRVDGITPKNPRVPGGHGVAVDYDQDGRLDLILGQGSEKDLGGPYRVLRNVNPISEQGNYLLVRVGIHPFRAATPLHAIVTVEVGNMTMTRRVGSAGTQRGGPSYLDTLHFGLGSFDRVNSVQVRWTAGKAFMRRSVKANQKITFGRVRTG